MRIALIGHGKMGRIVEELARKQEHEVVHIIDEPDNPGEKGFSGNWLRETEVMIDFSAASVVPQNIANAVKAGLPLVEGTTGWQNDYAGVKSVVEEGGGAVVHSSNFSVGVQVLFHMSHVAARLFSRFEHYHPYVVEYHHRHKQDAPSGTALSLHRIIRKELGDLPVSSLRAGFFPGRHEVGFDSPEDTLTLTHNARNREGFAHGALLAAQWVQGKRGFFDFKEVIFREEDD